MSQLSRSGRRVGTPRLVLAIASLASVALLSACSTPITPKTADPTHWVTTTSHASGALDSVAWNLLLEPSSLNPALSSNYGENVVLANLCESLLRVNPDFSITGGLAKLTTNAQHTVLTLAIDPAAKFWDGTPVTAEDAVFSLTLHWHPAVVSYWHGYFGSVASIEATSERVVTIKMTKPDLLFEKILSTTAGAVVEKAQAEAAGDAFGTASAPPVCSGPYKFVDWKQGSEIRIAKNDHYWRGATARVKEIVFTFLQGDASQTTAITGDAVQGMYNPPYSGLNQLASHGQVFYGESPLTFYVTPTQKPGPMQDPRIREALFLATDRKAVARTAFNGAAVAAQSLLSPSVYGDVNPTRTKGTGGSPEEIAKAKALVKEAGSPTATIVVAAFTGITESMNQSLQAMVEAGNKIGLHMQFKSITLAEYYGLFGGPDGWRDVNADAFGFQDFLAVQDPMVMYNRWATPDNIENYGGFSDSKLSASIKAASAEPDAAARSKMLAALDAKLFAEKPWIPLVNVANVLYMQKGLTGPPASFVDFFYPWAADLGSAG